MIIGRNTTAPASSHILGNGNRLCDSIGATLPASPAQRAIIVGAEMHTSLTGAATADLALYDVTDYPTDVGAPRVALVTLSIPNSNSFAFHTAAIDIDLSAYAGRTLKPAIGNPTGATTVRVNRVPGGSASSAVSGALPATWGGTANDTTIEPIIYFETEDIVVSGPTVTTITNPASDSMTITLSEAAATVDTISITYGGVTQSQSYTTGDDTTFTIASLTRNLLPPTGTVTVTLLAGVAEITSTTTALDDIPGWETTDLVSPVTTEGSVFYNHTGATPVTGDKVRHNDPGNTTISATGILTQTTPRTVTVEAWDDSDETYGSLGTFTYSTDTGQLVRVLQATALESTGMAATSLIATML